MKNKREKGVRKILDNLGLLSLHNGWPDFLIYDEEKAFVFCIEVKSKQDSVRDNQALAHKILKKAGIPVIVVTVDIAGEAIELDKYLEDEIQKAYEMFN